MTRGGTATIYRRGSPTLFSFRRNIHARDGNLPYHLSRHGPARLIGTNGQPHGEGRGGRSEVWRGSRGHKARVTVRRNVTKQGPLLARLNFDRQALGPDEIKAAASKRAPLSLTFFILSYRAFCPLSLKVLAEDRSPYRRSFRSQSTPVARER